MRKVSKEEVYTFLSKVENKAINSITEKFREQMNEAIKEYLKNNADLAVAFAALKINRDNLNAELRRFKTFIAPHHGIDTGRWELSEYELKIDDLVDYFTSHKITNSIKITELKKKFEEEKKALAYNYNVVRNVCKEKRDGNSAVRYLADLGFDVSYFDSAKVSIDTSKLFPCGEHGIK